MRTIAYHAIKTYGFEQLSHFSRTTVLMIDVGTHGHPGAVRVGVVLTEPIGQDAEAVAFRCDVAEGFVTDHVARIVQTSDDVWRIACDAARTDIRPES